MGDLYRHVTPLGEPIPVGDLPFLVDDGILEDEDIACLLRRLRLNLSGGPSGMRA